MPDRPVLIQRALDRVAREQRIVHEEQDAFRDFRERVHRSSAELPKTGVESTRKERGVSTAEMVEVYRETVMATPDYHHQYDDTVDESLAAELTPPVANGLQSKSRLTAPLRRDILVAASDAIDRRRKYLERLEAEEMSLTATGDQLADIEASLEATPPCSMSGRSFDELIDSWTRLESLRERCEGLLSRRQSTLDQARDVESTAGRTFEFNAYLYDGLESRFPVIRSIAETVARIDDRQRDPER